jgi:hypothetical protein
MKGVAVRNRGCAHRCIHLVLDIIRLVSELFFVRHLGHGLPMMMANTSLLPHTHPQCLAVIPQHLALPFLVIARNQQSLKVMLLSRGE